MKWENEEQWKTFRDNEYKVVAALLDDLGYILEEDQPHIQGERFLMQAVTTEHGQKLILIGKRKSDGLRVVIKTSPHSTDAEEIHQERISRKALTSIPFAYTTLTAPKEIFFGKKDGRVIFIQEFIPQKCQFIERPIKEQFSIALNAFKAQEGIRATTYKHHASIKNIFSRKTSGDYLHLCNTFITSIKETVGDEKIHTALSSVHKTLEKQQVYIEQYTDFLTHTDFVPHNFRVKEDTIYLLDHSSIRFGNKHEGWARFLNFMVLYNKELEEGFLQYMKDNTSDEEQMSLYLMRLYRLTELIFYYTTTLDRSTGNLRKLNEKRVRFWSAVLSHTLRKEPVPKNLIDQYKEERDELRSDEEKARQRNLH